MSRIGLIAGSYKPIHAGHFKLIEMAAQDNDAVYVFVSLKTRARPNEMPVYEDDMKEIWTKYIEPFLPPNVIVEYVTVPLRSLWEMMQSAEESHDTESVYTIYSDPEDLAARFSEQQFMKYIPTLYLNDQVITSPIERTSTVDVSGTKIRQAVANKNKELFMQGMPSQVDRDAIWNILIQRADERTPEKKTRGKNKKT